MLQREGVQRKGLQRGPRAAKAFHHIRSCTVLGGERETTEEQGAERGGTEGGDAEGGT